MRLWAVAEERALSALRGHDSAATTAAWSPDGEALATGDADGQVILWSARQQREISRIQLDNEATLLAFSPDGGWLLALSADHTTRLFPVHGGEAWRLGQAWTRRAQGAPDQAYTAALWAEDRVVLSARDGSVFAASPARTSSCGSGPPRRARSARRWRPRPARGSAWGSDSGFWGRAERRAGAGRGWARAWTGPGSGTDRQRGLEV